MTVIDEISTTERPHNGPRPGERHRLRPFVQAARDLLPVRGPAQLLSALAMLGVISALFHVGVWLIDDAATLSGPVSWRKPIVFALSIGLLGWTIGWLLDRLPERRGAWLIAVTYAVSGIVETGLITVQTWRGEASHFNTLDGGTNALIFALMGMAVVFMSVPIVAVAVWSLVERPRDPAIRLAAWWGFALVITGLGFGQWLVSLGSEYVDQFNEVPSTVLSGEAGVAKFPHAIALHGVQLFIVAAVMVGRAGLAARSARLFMTLIGASYTGLLLFTTLQTLAGRAPSQFSLGATVGLAGCLAVLCVTFGLLSRRLLSAPELGEARSASARRATVSSSRAD